MHAILLLVGPAEEETARIQDLADALSIYTDHDLDIYLIDDGHPRIHDHKIIFQSCAKDVYISKNPLRGKSNYLYERHTAGILYGLNEIYKNGHRQYAYTLKLDTDALVIGPYDLAIKKYFDTNPTKGIIGTYRKHPDGSDRSHPEQGWPRIIRQAHHKGNLLYFLLDIKRNGILNIPRAIKRCMDRKATFNRALEHGYEYGEHVLGGAYAISGKAVRTLGDSGLLGDYELFNYTNMGEDTSTSLLTISAGLKLDDFNQSGEPFAVWYKNVEFGYPTLLSDNRSVIHSTKSFASQDETILRDFFRSERLKANNRN